MTSKAVVGGMVYRDGELERKDVLVYDGRIAEVCDEVDVDDVDEVVDADGRAVLPGAIDVHVHFRAPGYTHKEDWRTGSRSAAAGGVTTVVDQPNTDPETVTGEAFDLKAEAAAEKSIVDYGVNAGVSESWQPEELFQRPVAAYGEVFMADSTGEMGVDADVFEDAVSEIQSRGYLVTVHAEDSSLFRDVELRSTDDWSRMRPPEAEVAAVEKAMEAAREPLHFAHVSHPDAVDVIAPTDHTCEVTPHHLLLSRDDLPELGTYGKMNPPLRSEEAREELWRRYVDGDVDCVATDHAPHTREEKDAPVAEAPSGVPGVETMLPLLLAKHLEGEVSLERVVRSTSRNPAAVFGFEDKGRLRAGYHADLVFVDLEAEPEDVDASGLHSRCTWTPFEGYPAVYPEMVLRRGDVVFHDGDFPFDGGGENVV